jgi:hypothetical protein
LGLRRELVQKLLLQVLIEVRAAHCIIWCILLESCMDISLFIS